MNTKLMSKMEILKLLSSCSFAIYLNLRLIYWYFEALFRYFLPSPMKSLDGETILITGGAGGIGREICRCIVQSASHIKLVILDADLKGMESLAEELEQSERAVRVYTYQTDVSSRENIEKVSQLVRTDVGRISVIINAAETGTCAKFLDLTETEIEETFQVNLMSQIWIIREFLGDMMHHNYGRIVNICSSAALTTGHFANTYFSSKYAVNGYTEALKSELTHFGYNGIHVTIAYPYLTKTELTKSANFVDNAEMDFPMPSVYKRFLKPEHVAREVVNGMRRENEFVYIPKVVGLEPWLDYLLPLKQRKFIYEEFTKCIMLPENTTKAEH